jgi:hypothetical protein
MNEGDPSDERVAFLAFVDRYWRELTLRDARSLCVEIIDLEQHLAAGIKTSLTYR